MTALLFVVSELALAKLREWRAELEASDKVHRYYTEALTDEDKALNILQGQLKSTNKEYARLRLELLSLTRAPDTFIERSQLELAKDLTSTLIDVERDRLALQQERVDLVAEESRATLEQLNRGYLLRKAASNLALGTTKRDRESAASKAAREQFISSKEIVALRKEVAKLVPQSVAYNATVEQLAEVLEQQKDLVSETANLQRSRLRLTLIGRERELGVQGGRQCPRV